MQNTDLITDLQISFRKLFLYGVGPHDDDDEDDDAYNDCDHHEDDDGTNSSKKNNDDDNNVANLAIVINGITIRNRDVTNKIRDIYSTQYRLLALVLNLVAIFIHLCIVSSTLSSYERIMLWLHIEKSCSFPCVGEHFITKPL